MIRVLSVSFAERSLLKGFTGAVTDLAFAHLDSSLLGCVDEAGNLMVWQLTCTGSKILYPEIEQECGDLLSFYSSFYLFSVCIPKSEWLLRGALTPTLVTSRPALAF